MEDMNKAAELDRYDTAINIIGGLRDCNVIFRAIESHFNQSDSLTVLNSGQLKKYLNADW